MFIRTNANIYEVEDKSYQDGKLTAYIIGDMAAIRPDQVISKEVENVEDLCDSFCLIVDGELKYADEELDAIESLAIKYSSDNIQIYGMIWSVSRFGKVKTKVVVKHTVDEKGYGHYKLLKEGDTI